MKNWIRVIVALNSRLDALTEKIDEEVSLMSTSLYEPTMDLINDIIALNDKKVKLINLRILHDIFELTSGHKIKVEVLDFYKTRDEIRRVYVTE